MHLLKAILNDGKSRGQLPKSDFKNYMMILLWYHLINISIWRLQQVESMHMGNSKLRVFWLILWANFYCCPHLLMILLWSASPFLNLKLGQLWYHRLTYWYRMWTQLLLLIWMFWMSLYRGTWAYVLQTPRRKDSLFSHLLKKHHSIWVIFSRQVPPPIETRSPQLIYHLGEPWFPKNSQGPGGGPVKVCTSTLQYWKSQTVVTRREPKLNDVHFGL